MEHPADPPLAAGSWRDDAILALVVVAVLIALRPLTPDGDGMYHAGRAIEHSFRDGMVAKHPLYAALLRVVYLALDATGFRAWTLEAFAIVSCLFGMGTYLLLARGLYPPLLKDVAVARLAALGTLAAYGVMQCCCSIETYAPALFFDVALITACVRLDVATRRGGVIAGGLFVLAVGMHASNVLLAPFLLVVLWRHSRGKSWSAAWWAVATVLLGGLFIAVALAGWPPQWRNLIPTADPEPSLGVGGRLARAVYGWLRTFVWLPNSWELTTTYVAIYAGIGVCAGLMVVMMARRLALRSRLGLLGLCALIAAPFIALGIKYYPSDPERWLFLVPIVWLMVGWIWADYKSAASAGLSSRTTFAMLTALVIGMAVFNGGYKLWPEARHNRERAGAVQMAAHTQPGDVVISSSQLSLVYQEFVIGRLLDVEIVPLDAIMLHEHPQDVRAGQEALRQRVRTELQNGRRVFVLALLGEDLAAGRGYPWAWVEPAGYRPEIMLEVLREFQAETIVSATSEQTGTFRLRLKSRNG